MKADGPEHRQREEEDDTAQNEEQEQADRNWPFNNWGQLPAAGEFEHLSCCHIPGGREEQGSQASVEQSGHPPPSLFDLARTPLEQRVRGIIRPELDACEESRQRLQRDAGCRERVL